MKTELNTEITLCRLGNELLTSITMSFYANNYAEV